MIDYNFCKNISYLFVICGVHPLLDHKKILTRLGVGDR